MRMSACRTAAPERNPLDGKTACIAPAALQLIREFVIHHAGESCGSQFRLGRKFRKGVKRGIMALRLTRPVPVSAETRTPPEPPTKKPKTTLAPDTTESACVNQRMDPALSPVESAAQSLLDHSQERPISHADILNLWTLIPPNKRLRPKPSQVPDGPPESARNMTYVILGLSPRTPNHLTNLSFALKSTIGVINRFIHSWAPGFKYSTIAIIANGNKGPHRDLNAEGLSFLTCLTTQDGGDLWIHNDKAGDSAVQHHGKTLWGDVVQIKQQPILFPSRALIHACTPWKGTTRVVLIAFNSLHARSLSTDHRSTLNLIWKVPAPSPEDLDIWRLQFGRQRGLREYLRDQNREPSREPSDGEKPTEP